MSEPEARSSESSAAWRSKRRHWSFWAFVAVFWGGFGWWIVSLVLGQLRAPVESVRSDAVQFAWAVHEGVSQPGVKMTDDQVLLIVKRLIETRRASEFSDLDGAGNPVDHWDSPYRITWQRGSEGRATVTCTSLGPDRTESTDDDIVGRASTMP